MGRNKSAQPVRSCVICRKHCAKVSLARYVWEPEKGNVILDREQILSGRGAYCCRDETCRHRFLTRRQGWKRAFRLH